MSEEKEKRLKRNLWLAGALLLVILLVLGSVGVAYARSTGAGALKSHHTVFNGGALVQVFSSDEPGSDDPVEPGSWNSANPSAWQGERLDMDIACTSAVIEGSSTIRVTAQNAYPGYCPSVLFRWQNIYGFPVKVSGVVLNPSFPAGELSVSLSGLPLGGVTGAGGFLQGVLQICTGPEAQENHLYAFTASLNLESAANQPHPTPPQLRFPLKGSHTGDLTPRLEWLAPGADTCTLQISRSPDFASRNIILEKTGLGNCCFVIPAGTLEKNRVYYWRVRSTGFAGESDWTPAWFFSTPAE